MEIEDRESKEEGGERKGDEEGRFVMVVLLGFGFRLFRRKGWRWAGLE